MSCAGSRRGGWGHSNLRQPTQCCIPWDEHTEPGPGDGDCLAQALRTAPAAPRGALSPRIAISACTGLSSARADGAAASPQCSWGNPRRSQHGTQPSSCSPRCQAWHRAELPCISSQQHIHPFPSLPAPPRALLMDDGGPCRVGRAARGGKRYLEHLWLLPSCSTTLAPAHDARSYLVSSRPLLAVGTLQEPRLFGKFI